MYKTETREYQLYPQWKSLATPPPTTVSAVVKQVKQPVKKIKNVYKTQYVTLLFLALFAYCNPLAFFVVLMIIISINVAKREKRVITTHQIENTIPALDLDAISQDVKLQHMYRQYVGVVNKLPKLN